MQLQYVLANPGRKKVKKPKSGLHKKHASGNTKVIAKKKKRKKSASGLSKGSKAAKAWGLKMKKLREAKSGKVKRVKRKKRVVLKNLKRKRKLSSVLGGTVAKKRKKKKSTHKKRKSAKRVAAGKKAARSRKRHKAMKKAKRKHSKKKHVAKKRRRKHKKAVVVVASNPKRRRRKHRKSVSKKRKHRKARRNPSFSMAGMDLDAVKAVAIPAAMGALGYLVTTNIIIPKIIDPVIAMVSTGNTTATLTTKALNAIPVLGAYLAPYAVQLAGIAVGVGAIYAVKKAPIGAKAKQQVTHAALGGIAAASLLIALSLGQKGLTSVGMSGVKFFPTGMSGADFGMLPQMGDGYKQSAGDFGIIPQGMRGIPQGMNQGVHGVEYFPSNGMGQVQFYADGSNGDDMFRQSEAGDMEEAEGLGEIPAGLGSPDFGEIPSGMGGGQLG